MFIARRSRPGWLVGGHTSYNTSVATFNSNPGLYFLHIYRLLVPHGAFLEDDTAGIADLPSSVEFWWHTVQEKLCS